MRKLAAMITEAEQEIFEEQAFDKFYYKYDENGICYDRFHNGHDNLMDGWHPWERVSFEN